MQTDLFRLDAPEVLASFLHSRGWLPADEPVTDVGRAGEGNMNFVARVRTPTRSVILKQSRPYVEKYPQVAAPADRILTEVAVYQAVSGVPAVRSRMPALLGVDAPARAALFEDLGEVADYADAYDGVLLPDADLGALAEWLGALHPVPVADPDVFRNRDMRALNHAHLFEIPLAAENGLDLDGLTPGLAAEAARLRVDAAYVAAVADLGSRYLADGETLLHGDFYPGSWVRTVQGPFVIDPEFAFLGPAAFDLGVAVAHLLMAGVDDVSGLLDAYPGPVDEPLVAGFAGVEIMRRLLGVAQLPMTRDLEEKARLLRRSARLVLDRVVAPALYRIA